MPYMNLDHLELYYEEFGYGEPILFLHSHFSRGILAFSAQIQPFAGKYRCIFPDFRGHGRSKSEDLSWDSRRNAKDMFDFLDALKIERVHLIGYSMGSYVGLYMASMYPKRIKSFIGIGSSTKPMPNGSEDFLPENVILQNNQKLIQDTLVRHIDAHQGNWQEFLRQTVSDWQNHPSLSDKEWQAITCPLFFINGELDEFGSCHELLKKCPHAQIYEVPQGTHRPHFVMEQGKEINERMLAFLDKQSVQEK